MNRTCRQLGLATALLAGIALASCGGNDNDDPPATSQVPASASQSVGGFIDYLEKLVVATADMLEPVDVSTVMAPTDETGEPRTLP